MLVLAGCTSYNIPGNSSRSVCLARNCVHLNETINNGMAILSYVMQVECSGVTFFVIS